MKILYTYLVVGIILNIIGPLAKYLRCEYKYALKENKNENWFYIYSMIFAVRFVSVIYYPIFFFNYYIRNVKPEPPISFEDKLDASLVKRFRSIGENNNCAPSEKTSDEKIIEIYKLICSSFRKVSIEREERIAANSLNTIALKFFNVYEEFGDDFMKEHLEYELYKYSKEGLRPEYQKGISLL